jgi:ribose 5-phosphate isomerase B
MVIYLGADHRGFSLKETLKEFLKEKGYEAVDLGGVSYDEKDDYPDFASAVARKVSAAPRESRGVLACGSGAGVDIVANKFPNVRSVLALSSNQVYDARHDDDVNVLSFSADSTDPAAAQKLLATFLETPWSEAEKDRRRLQKIAGLEGELYK